MGWPARLVVIMLFIMSAWSIGVMIDRVIAYNGARKQSRQFAPAVAGALREGKLDEAIKIADRFSKSHLAKVVVAGLQEFRAHQLSSEISGEEIEASKPRSGTRRSHRARRAEARHFEPGDHRFHGSVRGTVRNGAGHHQRVQGHFDRKVDRSGRGRGRYFGSAGHHRRRSVRGHPGRLVFNYFTNRVEAFDVEMGNSSSELIDYFLKRAQRAGAGK